LPGARASAGAMHEDHPRGFVHRGI
jgi:hypothetical protein